MSTLRHRRAGTRSALIDGYFRQASDLWERGELRRAFRFFLAAAKEGDESCQLNVGYFYDEGLGVRRSSDKALFWYRRAYRNGSASAAANIGLILREKGKPKTSLEWLLRALRGGNQDSALDIGLAYLSTQRGLSRAIKYLRLAAKSKAVTEATRERARTLLQEALRKRERSRSAE